MRKITLYMLHLDRTGSLAFIASMTSAVHGHGSTVVVVCSSVVVEVEVVVLVVVVVEVVVVAEKVILVLKKQIFEKRIHYFSVKADFDGCTMRIRRAASEIHCHFIFIKNERLGAMQILFYGTGRKGQSQ